MTTLERNKTERIKNLHKSTSVAFREMNFEKNPNIRLKHYSKVIQKQKSFNEKHSVLKKQKKITTNIPSFIRLTSVILGRFVVFLSI